MAVDPTGLKQQGGSANPSDAGIGTETFALTLALLGGNVTYDEKNGVYNIESGILADPLKQNGAAAMTIGNAIFWASDSSPISDPKIYAHELVHASVQSPLLGDMYLPVTAVSYGIGAIAALSAGNTTVWAMHDAAPLEMHADMASNQPTRGPSIWRQAFDNIAATIRTTMDPILGPGLPRPSLP